MTDIRQRQIDLIDKPISKDKEEDDDLFITIETNDLKLKVSQKRLNKDKTLLNWVLEKLTVPEAV